MIHFFKKWGGGEFYDIFCSDLYQDPNRITEGQCVPMWNSGMEWVKIRPLYIPGKLLPSHTHTPALCLHEYRERREVSYDGAMLIHRKTSILSNLAIMQRGRRGNQRHLAMEQAMKEVTACFCCICRIMSEFWKCPGVTKISGRLLCRYFMASS